MTFPDGSAFEGAFREDEPVGEGGKYVSAEREKTPSSETALVRVEPDQQHQVAHPDEQHQVSAPPDEKDQRDFSLYIGMGDITGTSAANQMLAEQRARVAREREEERRRRKREWKEERRALEVEIHQLRNAVRNDGQVVKEYEQVSSQAQKQTLRVFPGITSRFAEV